MEATIEETNSLSQEVAKFNRSIEALKRTLSLQRSPLNKSDLGNMKIKKDHWYLKPSFMKTLQIHTDLP